MRIRPFFIKCKACKRLIIVDGYNIRGRCIKECGTVNLEW